MYSAEFQDSIRAVEAARAANIAYEPARMTAQEKEDLLAAYHPDYKKSEFSELKIGPNRRRPSGPRTKRRASAPPARAS